MGRRNRINRCDNRNSLQPVSEGLKVNADVDGGKQIVIIETPPTSPQFIQVTALMTDQELEQAKKERPDLIFRIPVHMAIEKALLEEPEGESLNGMTLPADVQERWLKDLVKE